MSHPEPSQPAPIKDPAGGTLTEDATQAIRSYLLGHYADIIRGLASAKPLFTDEPPPQAPSPPIDPVPEVPQPVPIEPPASDSSLQAAQQLLQARNLADEQVLVVWLRGLYVLGLRLVLCAGVSMTGHRRILGLVESSPENVRTLHAFLQDLKARGLTAKHGLLWVLPSGTGLQRAVRAVWGPQVPIQRCLTTKLYDVVGGLPLEEMILYRHRLRQAWHGPDAVQAEAMLREIHSDLLRVNRSAAHVLMEGLPETLTVQRTGLLHKVDRRLRVTTFVASVGQRLRPPSGALDQRMARICVALLECETRFRRVSHVRFLPDLKLALTAP